MEQYLPIALILVLSIVFAAGMVATPKMLGPRRPTGAKQGPYESGIVPRYAPASRFAVRFYLVAMIFIIFDIEVVFLYPWAVIYHQLATFGLAEMAAFAVVVFVSFAYLVSNGVLDWGPRQPEGGKAPVDLARTMNATVRRVARPVELLAGLAPRPSHEPPREPAPESEPAHAGTGPGSDG
jgi:NADH-quinone oxidoreductase subunit A